LKELPKKARVRAQVGWTGSGADKRRIDELNRWMATNRAGELASRANELADVKFDLVYEGDPSPLYGKDFLTDSRRFEIVVLHHIFVGWTELDSPTKPAIGDHPCFACSPIHSPEAWRRRLRASGAQRIFAFGANFEVASSFLLAIPGYQKVVTSFGAVYERRRLSHAASRGAVPARNAHA
jgi:hypothetical protein